MYLNCAPQITEHRKGERTISMELGGFSSRLTLCFAVAEDGIKITLFVIMKGEPDCRIEKSLRELLPHDILGCNQRNAWMDKRAKRNWN